MTYSQLAGELKVHKSQITHLLKGSRPFRLTQLDKIASAFEIPAYYLVRPWETIAVKEDTDLAAAAHVGGSVLFPTDLDADIKISNALVFEEMILKIEAKEKGLSEEERKKISERFIANIESGKTDIRTVIKGLMLDLDPDSIPDAPALPKKSAKKSATKSSRRKKPS